MVREVSGLRINDMYQDVFLTNESARCLLCEDAPCTNACPKGLDPAKFIRSLRMQNTQRAATAVLPNCIECSGECEKACLHYDTPIRVRELICFAKYPKKTLDDVDLSIRFCGVECENPFFLSSSVVASNYEMCAEALRAGWAGVVFKTIGFLKPKEVSPRFDATEKEGTPFIGFRNLEQISDHTLEENLRSLRELKRDFPNKVIVSSIMGETEEEWTELAKLSEEAGVDIIECNFSCPQMTVQGTGSDVGQNPQLVRRYTEYTRKGTKLPILAKMTPNLGNMEIPAKAAMQGGATGIAAINTVKSISGIDLEHMVPTLHIEQKSSVSGYSGKAVKPIALRFINDMAKHKGLQNVPLSGMGGIETWRDAAEFIALGCGNIQVTTSVMQYGYRIIEDMISGTKDFMKRNGYKHVDDFLGSALKNVVVPEELNRETIVYPQLGTEQCVGCGRCYVSCRDAGHQAIRFSKGRKPVLIAQKCVGCHLCKLVCPVGAIGSSRRVKKKEELSAERSDHGNYAFKVGGEFRT